MKPIAPLSLRIIAYLIDLCIFLLILQIIFIYFLSVADASGLLARFIECIIYFFTIGITLSFVYAYLISKFGGTIGKMVCGLSIVTPNGENVTFKRAFFRSTVGYMVSGSFIFLGFFWIFKDEKRRGWHDMVSETLVVTARSENLMIPLLGLIGILVLNIVIFSSITTKFKTQIPMYIQVGRMIENEFVSPSPTPSYFRRPIDL